MVSNVILFVHVSSRSASLLDGLGPNTLALKDRTSPEQAAHTAKRRFLNLTGLASGLHRTLIILPASNLLDSSCGRRTVLQAPNTLALKDGTAWSQPNSKKTNCLPPRQPKQQASNNVFSDALPLAVDVVGGYIWYRVPCRCPPPMVWVSRGMPRPFRFACNLQHF